MNNQGRQTGPKTALLSIVEGRYVNGVFPLFMLIGTLVTSLSEHREKFAIFTCLTSEQFDRCHLLELPPITSLKELENNSVWLNC